MADTTSSDVTEGPVLNLINKRLRALRKKLNRIIQMEESVAQGKVLNKEQEEVLRSKPAVVATIDELEKLRQPLSSAVQEEFSLSVQQRQLTEPLDVLKNEPSPPDSRDSDRDSATHVDHSALVVEDLLNLIYFGSLFDMRSQNSFTSPLKTLERNCCLSYDYVTDDATDPLSERDLDLISILSGLMISRPPNSTLPHKNALQRCVEHAKLWLEKSEQPIDPNNNVTYAGLRERLNKILSSEYLSITPLDTPIELAAAAAVNFTHFPGKLESSVPQSEHQWVKEEAENFQEQETADAYHPEQENQKDEEETEHVEAFIQQEQIQLQAGMEQNQRGDIESQEHQCYPRRSHQNQRGGHRGQSNGRGGRSGSRGNGYQNGRHQYYDQPGNYHPRPQYFRGSGGRGGGYNQSNHSSGDQGSQMTVDGLQS